MYTQQPTTDHSASPEGDEHFDADRIPDVRDGLTREQRIILHTLYEAQRERPGRAVPTIMLYGRVVSRLPMSKNRFQALLSQLVGRGAPDA